MHWIDEGLVIGVRMHGEASVIVELLTDAHGRHLGIVRGGRSRRMRPVLQLGNRVRAAWSARLEEHLGNFAVEPIASRAGALMSVPAGLYGISYLAALARLLPERDPHAEIAAAAEVVAQHLADGDIGPALLARFELRLLAELGFGLDLLACAATGRREELIWVSPRSGRAVSREAGLPWADRLLPLPPFLLAVDEDAPPSEAEVDAAFRLTGFFLARDVMEPRGLMLPDERRAYLAAARCVAV
jgi:DNA repair protein RecO (recombination protein O)